MIKKYIEQHLIYFVWGLAIILASIILSHTNYASKSNDSRFYSEQVEAYYQKPWSEILTPKWGNNYGFDPNSYMRDQFPGQMVIGVVGAKLGIVAKHSLHVIEMIFQVLSIWVLVEIAKYFMGPINSKILFLGLLLISPAFSHNLRANHESGIALFSFLALWAGIKFKEKNWIYGLMFILSTFMLLFIKGPFFIFGLALFTIGIWASYQFNVRSSFKIFFPYLFILLLSTIVNLGFIWGFEKYFQAITGESFLSEFYRLQFVERALEVKNQYPFLIQKFLNFYYYFEHCLTYSLPWSLIALLIFLKKKIKKEHVEFYSSNLSKSFLLSALVYCLVFSTSNRIAGRYAHPAYYLTSAWMILFCYFNSKSFSAKISGLKNSTFISLVVLLWFLAFLLPLYR